MLNDIELLSQNYHKPRQGVWSICICDLREWEVDSYCAVELNSFRVGFDIFNSKFMQYNTDRISIWEKLRKINSITYNLYISNRYQDICEIIISLKLIPVL